MLLCPSRACLFPPCTPERYATQKRQKQKGVETVSRIMRAENIVLGKKGRERSALAGKAKTPLLEDTVNAGKLSNKAKQNFLGLVDLVVSVVVSRSSVRDDANG